MVAFDLANMRWWKQDRLVMLNAGFLSMSTIFYAAADVEWLLINPAWFVSPKSDGALVVNNSFKSSSKQQNQAKLLHFFWFVEGDGTQVKFDLCQLEEFPSPRADETGHALIIVLSGNGRTIFRISHSDRSELCGASKWRELKTGGRWVPRCTALDHN